MGGAETLVGSLKVLVPIANNRCLVAECRIVDSVSGSQNRKTLLNLVDNECEIPSGDYVKPVAFRGLDHRRKNA